MALYSGVTGSISIDDTKIIHMSGWDVELTKEMIDVNSFGDDYTERVPSIKSWSASGDGTTDFEEGGGQAELHAAYESGAEVDANFYLDENTFLSGKAFVESLSITHTAGGASEISISLAGSKATTLNLPE